MRCKMQCTVHCNVLGLDSRLCAHGSLQMKNSYCFGYKVNLQEKYKTNTVAMEESDFDYGGMTWQQMCARLKCKSQLVSAQASVTNIVLYLYFSTNICIFIQIFVCVYTYLYLYLYTNIYVSPTKMQITIGLSSSICD